MTLRLVAIALTAAGATQRAAAASVLCGGHFAQSCAECPDGNDAAWCHGDCMWLSNVGSSGGQCVPKIGVALSGGANPTTAFGASFLPSAMIMTIFACCYHQKVIKGPPELPKATGNTSVAKKGLFECLCRMDTCLYTAFCMPVVIGKNYFATGLMGFWPGCCISFLLTYSPFYLCSACFRAYMSGQIQDKLGVEHSCCMDFVHAMFCYPCDVGRESMEVDAELGVEITCCCNIKHKPLAVAEVEQVVEKVKVSRTCDGVRKYRMCGGEGH